MIDSTEALENLKELFLETGKLQMWLKDPRVSGELQAAAKAETARKMTLAFLTQHFGALPEAWVAQIMTADADWCQNLFDRAITGATLAELLDNP